MDTATQNPEVPAAQADWAETRRLASQIIKIGEHLLSFTVTNAPPGLKPARLQLSVIRSTVAAYYGIRVEKIITQDRHAKLAWARMVAMFLARELTDLSFEEIGNDFKRDHGSVCNACKVVKSRCETEPRTAGADVVALRSLLERQ